MSEKFPETNSCSSALHPKNTVTQVDKMPAESSDSSFITHHSSLLPLAWLESRMMFGMKAGLENMCVVCERLGNPQKNLRTIHVVGTNGKGSTSFWTMRILESHGLRVGLFTSPHLVSVRERIRVGDSAISEEDFCRLLEQVRQASFDREITFFEVITAVALVWYTEQNLDTVVLEAGLGGRLDSTNICDSSHCVLTSIGFDHMEILGNTTSEILMEKLGVWKRGATLFHNLSDTELAHRVESEATVRSATAVRVITDHGLSLAQPAEVYQENASLAMAVSRAILGIEFLEDRARSTLRTSVWAGRLQELRNQNSGKLEWILDGAHNGHAALRLAESLGRDYAGLKFSLIIAVLKTKDPQEILLPLFPYVKEIFVTRTPHEKMRDPEEIQKLVMAMGTGISVQCIPEASQALLRAQNSDYPVLCTGSLYFVGAAIQLLKDQYEELSWFRQFSPSDNERK